MAQPRASSEDAVLRAAAEVFRRLGYQASTIEDIAKAAGISKPTVYTYARSKRWLLDRIVETLWREMIDITVDVYDADEPANVRFFRVVRVYVDLATQYRTFFRVTLNEETELSDETRAISRDYAHRAVERLTELLRDCEAEGTLHNVDDIDATARLILSMLTSLHRWYYPEHSLSEGALAAQIVQVVSGVVVAPERPWDDYDRPTPPLATSVVTAPSQQPAASA